MDEGLKPTPEAGPPFNNHAAPLPDERWFDGPDGRCWCGVRHGVEPETPSIPIEKAEVLPEEQGIQLEFDINDFNPWGKR